MARRVAKGEQVCLPNELEAYSVAVESLEERAEYLDDRCLNFFYRRPQVGVMSLRCGKLFSIIEEALKANTTLSAHASLKTTSYLSLRRHTANFPSSRAQVLSPARSLVSGRQAGSDSLRCSPSVDAPQFKEKTQTGTGKPSSQLYPL